MHVPFIEFHRYDSVTGRYLGPVPAYLDPLESSDEQPVYAAPANAIAASPAGELAPCQSYRLNAAGDAWDVVPDYSQAEIWDTTTGLRCAPTAFGESLPANLATDPPPATGEYQACEWDTKKRRWRLVPDYSGAVLRSTETTALVPSPPRGLPLPAKVTAVPLPIMAPKEAAQWDVVQEAWQIVPDHRGETWYRTADGSPTMLAEIGAVPDGLTQLPPPSRHHHWDGAGWILDEAGTVALLAEQREAAAAAVTQWKEAQIAAGTVFEFDGHRWDGGLTVRYQMASTIAAAEQIGLPTGFFWTDADDRDVAVTLDQLKALQSAHELAMVARGWEIHARQREMKREVAEMTLEQLAEFVPCWPKH
ncbi:DUF4376 domain-containing protein [Crenobacter sp. SG2303]|uniref:DUF4376 domain-containing protein n=1 Tax=Crenobacter oryzisoli TaxID=3056844 RepID=A0ABT7XP92_9NEIS|nr:DUF4376 domain-containing protein [Crenobacter sp. SG2303]MDN0075603.1 DUF4376 domain-containing protein [Crenobacter sp. SG2303]